MQPTQYVLQKYVNDLPRRGMGGFLGSFIGRLVVSGGRPEKCFILACCFLRSDDMSFA
jgi:hypothetical protein